MIGVEKLLQKNTDPVEKVDLYKESLEKMNGVLFIIDYNSNSLSWAGENFEEILGYNSDRLTNLSDREVKDLYLPKDFYIHKERYDFFMNPETKDKSHTSVCRIKHQNGHYIWLYFSIFVISRNSDDTPQKAGGIMINLEKLMGSSFLEKFFMEKEKNTKPHKMLSKRQTEILNYTRQGLSASQVAEKLNLSKRTVESHKRIMHKKFGFKNTAALIGYVSNAGYLLPDF